MTIVVTHTTPADSSFSTEGAAAWNANHALSGVGTMAEQDANNVAITGGSINNTVIGNTTPNAATFTTLKTTGQADLGGDASNPALKVNATAGVNRWVEVTGFANGQPLLSSWSTGSAAGLNFGTRGAADFEFRTGSNSFRQFNIAHTASAVNYVQVTGAATGSGATISAQGSDSNVGLAIRGKGSGFVSIGQDTTTQFAVSRTASAVNYLLASGGATGFDPTLTAFGSDTNISMAFQSKGTGGISLSTGSTGTNLVNGTTVTAITGTAAGNGYTSFPTVTISAPTTAGGVQATVSVTRLFQNLATIASGGTGYSVNDVLTVVGGTPAGVAATLTVTAVSGGVITAVSSTNFAQYTALPTNPVSVTGGTGSGATLNLQWSVLTGAGSYTITNAGSGYVEQPTVTFSGGGGSGATAFATIGSANSLKSLNDLTVNLPSGPVLSMSDSSLPGTGAYLNLSNGSTSSVISRAVGTNTNLNFYWLTKGTGGHYFNTNNSTSISQFNVSHTASAVNYVQVTGSATSPGGAALANMLFTGSDASVNGAIVTKGTGYIAFAGGANTGSQALRIVTTNAVNTGNLIQIQGAAAGSAPTISAISGTSGTDTNIDLALTPKGTGRVQFGTYTANMALTVQGYIEIKDSGGTVRRLAVVA